MTQQVPLLINGELVQSRSENWIPVTNPATQEVIAQVPCATPAEVDQAVEISGHFTGVEVVAFTNRY